MARSAPGDPLHSARFEPKRRAGRPGPSRPSSLPESGRRDGAHDGIALILEEEPDLAHGLSQADRTAATNLLRAPVLRVDSPRWEPPELDPARTFGLLVLDGLLGRRVQLGRARSTELLGVGDILRPWDAPTAWDLVPPKVSWRVFQPARLAVLDERITAMIGRRAELIVAFSGRLLRRSRHAAYLAAAGHVTRVEDRLRLTLWHLASSWGRVTPEGVVVPFRLTHEVLGEIIGAQRPSVTVAMGDLQRSGQVIRNGDGAYILTGRADQALDAAYKHEGPLRTPELTRCQASKAGG
jgi:CRP/FNR family transcriptional regulator, cyclic AMP receptor protein